MSRQIQKIVFLSYICAICVTVKNKNVYISGVVSAIHRYNTLTRMSVGSKVKGLRWLQVFCTFTEVVHDFL